MNIKLTNTDLQFVVRRIPKDIRELMMINPLWIGGGFIRETISGGEVNDIDLFSSSKEGLFQVSKLLNLQRSESKLHTSDNAITLLSPPRIPVQFITRWTFSDPEESIKSFDFTVCQAVIYYNKEIGSFDSVISEFFYSDLAAKRLTYTNPIREEEAGGSMLRVLKFIKRGYNIEPLSLGQVIARLTSTIDYSITHIDVGAKIGGLLRDVDPLLVVDGLEWINGHEPLDAVN